MKEFTDEQFQDLKDDTSVIMEEFSWRSTVGEELGQITDLLQNHILNDISSQLDTSLEYEMFLNLHERSYIAEYVLDCFFKNFDWKLIKIFRKKLHMTKILRIISICQNDHR